MNEFVMLGMAMFTVLAGAVCGVVVLGMARYVSSLFAEEKS